MNKRLRILVTAALVLGGLVHLAATEAPPARAAGGTLVISEFRLRGPAGAQDEFIEIANIGPGAETVAASDGSGGLAVAFSDNKDFGVLCIIPNGTVIPRFGHFLCANTTAYSLAGYPADNGTTATPDVAWAGIDIRADAGLALFNTATAANFGAATRIDAVGFTSSPALFREGSGIPNPAGFDIEHSYLRNYTTDSLDTFGPANNGVPQDTNDNAADFFFVDTNGTNNQEQRLGAPGPENSSSPRATPLQVGLLDPCVSALSPPNVVRDFTDDPGNPNDTYGTVDYRRTVTNNTGADVTRLRFRIADIRTFPPSPGFADLRPLSSTAVVVTVDRAPCGTGTSNVTVNGTTLEQPPAQPNGGGFNSSLSAGTVTLATPLADGASVDVRFLFGVSIQGGTAGLRIFAEALGDGSTVGSDPAIECLGGGVEGSDFCTGAVTIDQAAGQPDPAAGQPINFTATFAEDVTGFGPDDIVFGGTAPGTPVATITGGPRIYNVAVSGLTGSGTVRAFIREGAATAASGRPNAESTSTDNTVTFTNPVTVTINQAAGQPDPAQTAPINFTATFDRPVTGFTGSDVSFTGSTAPGALVASVTGGPTVFNVAVSGMSGPGTVVASVPANSVQDANAAPNTASTSTDNTVTFAPCSQTYSGNVPGNVSVGSGSTCVQNANITGSVTVGSGGRLFLMNSTVGGSLTSTGASSVTVCGTTVNGLVRIQGTTGFALVGGDGAAGCAGNTFKSTVGLLSNTGGLRLAGNRITGGTQVSNNTAPAGGVDPAGGPARIVVRRNTIGGSLVCSGNSPAASNDGGANTVTGSRSGECASSGF